MFQSQTNGFISNQEWLFTPACGLFKHDQLGMHLEMSRRAERNVSTSGDLPHASRL